MIILEGPDLAGKTTLAHMIVDDVNADPDDCAIYQHMTRLPDGFDRLHGYLRLINRDVVMDRFHVSEIAYCHAREEPRESWSLTPAKYSVVEERLGVARATTVLILPTEDQLRHRYDAAREMYDLEAVLRAREAYELLASGEWPEYRTRFDYVVRGRFPESRDARAIVETRNALLADAEWSSP